MCNILDQIENINIIIDNKIEKIIEIIQNAFKIPVKKSDVEIAINNKKIKSTYDFVYNIYYGEYSSRAMRYKRKKNIDKIEFKKKKELKEHWQDKYHSLDKDDEESLKGIIEFIRFCKADKYRKLQDKAKERVRKAKSLLAGNIKRHRIIFYSFVFSLTYDGVNAILKNKGNDGLHSRNIEEGLAIYYLKKNQFKTINSITELYKSYHMYRHLIYKYNSYMSAKLGVEFSEVLYEHEKDISIENSIVVSENIAPTIYKNKEKCKVTSLMDIITMMKESVNKYEEIAKTTEGTKKTTTYMLKAIEECDDIEGLIEREQKIWCVRRNKPLKNLIPLIESAYKDVTISFDKFAYEIFSFYYVPLQIQSPYYKGLLTVLDRRLGDNTEQECTNIKFFRVIKRLLFSISSMNKNQYISLLMFLHFKNNKAPELNKINNFLEDVEFDVLSESDWFFKEWIESSENANDIHLNFVKIFKEKCLDSKDSYKKDPNFIWY